MFSRKLLKTVCAVAWVVLLAAVPAVAEPQKAADAPELQATVPSDFVAHTNEAHGVSVSAPKDWQPAKVEQGSSVVINLVDAKRRSANVVATAAVKGQTVEKTVDILPKVLPQMMKEFKLIKADLVKLAGEPAARLQYEATPQPKLTLRFCQYTIVKNNTQYVLTFTCRPEEYDALLPTMDQMAVTFKVTPKAAR